MKNAIIYTRVSTDDQAQNGFSLPDQERRLTEFCKLRGFNIIKHFQDDHSAKTFDRPEWIKLEQFCKANKKEIHYLLVLRWDRFSRSLEFALSKIRIFKDMGIEINAVEAWIDYQSTDRKILLGFYLGAPESENDKNSIRTTEGSRRARLEGCWTGPAPYGYTNSRTVTGKSTLIPNEKSTVIKTAFQMLSTGIKTAEEVRKTLSKDGLTLHKQAFLDLIKNICYTGKIRVKAWGKDDEEIVDGLHIPIITEDCFGRYKESWIPEID